MWCEQGADLIIPITTRNPDGTVQDLSTYTAELRVAKTKGGTLALNPTTANGQITLSNVKPNVLIEVSHTITALLDPTQYVYDLDLIAPNGKVYRKLEGNFIVDGEV
jgi:hypothetical protein